MFGFFSKNYEDLSPSQAASRKDLLVVDVREHGEVREGMIAGARHVPLGSLLTGGLVDCAPDAPILVVCRSGGRSAAAAKALTSRGFTAVHNLSGGMMAWQSAGLPVRR